MNVFTIMRMELKFILSQGFTSLLILLYPFVLMMVAGPVFASPSAEGAAIVIYSANNERLPELEPEADGPYSKVSGIGSQQIVYVDSKEEMIERVLSGRAVLGISIERDASSRKRIYVYFEPTKEIVANALALQLQGKLADASAELVETHLIAVWNNMQALSRDIDSKLQKIPELRNSFYNSRNRIQELQNNLQTQEINTAANSLSQIEGDVSSMQQGIADMQNKLVAWDNAANELSNYDSKLLYYDGRLASTDNQLLSIRNNLYSWDSKLANRITQLDSAYNTMANYLQIVRNLKAGATGSTYDQLVQVENGIVNAMNEVSSARNELQQMRNELQQMQNQITSARNEIAAARNDIANTRSQIAATSANARNDVNAMRNQLNDASNRLYSATTNIQNARNNINAFSSFTYSMQNYLSQSYNELNSLVNELDGTESLLRNAKQNMAQFLANNPQDYVPSKFEKFSEKKQLRYLDSLFPVIIGLVSMLSCLLLPPVIAVKQKAQGVRTRMKLSYAGPFSIVTGKFLGDYLVGLVQVLVVTLVGSMVFGVNLGTHYLALATALLLAPAVFTAIGMFLAGFVSNEGSAVLSSLLVSMPMIFLSGILLPIELVHGALRGVGLWMPLYNVTEMISKVTVRDAPMYAWNNYFASVFYLVLFLLLAYILWNNKE